MYKHDKGAQEKEELFKALTEKALANEHTEFEYLKSPGEWIIIKKTRKGLKKFIELYNQVSWSVYNAYCKQVLEGTQDFGLLYALRQYLECEQFYKKELETVNDMLAEYNAYLGKGHFLEQFLWGQERESWRCWDHRGEGPYGD
jgi:hypothetical protein